MVKKTATKKPGIRICADVEFQIYVEVHDPATADKKLRHLALKNEFYYSHKPLSSEKYYYALKG